MGRLTHIHIVHIVCANLGCQGASDGTCEPLCWYSRGGGGECMCMSVRQAWQREQRGTGAQSNETRYRKKERKKKKKAQAVNICG